MDSDAERAVTTAQLRTTLVWVQREIAGYGTGRSQFCTTENDLERFTSWVPRAVAAIAAFEDDVESEEQQMRLLDAAMREM